MDNKKMLMLGGAILIGYLLWKRSKKKSEDDSNFTNASGDIQSYRGKGGRKICYVTDPRGSIQQVPCP